MQRSIAVGLGIMEFPFDTTAGFWRWVDLCEAGGIDSLWQTDRLISRAPILECMSALAAIAGRTRRLKFGVNVVSVAMREPVLLAKQCATIDMLSGGRLLPGFGIGSPRGPEWQAMHLDPTTRGRKTDEALEIIRRLWAGDKLDYEGKHFRLTGAQIAPLPAQPDLPMWIGGSSDAAVRRTARYGTGWQAGAEPAEEVGRVIAAIRAAVVEAGRHIDDDHYGAACAYRFGGLGRSGHGPGGGGLSRPHRPRRARGVRGGRRDDDHDADCRICRGRGVEVHSAPGGAGRRRHAGADAAADRGGAAAGRRALAAAGEERGVR